jgi:hypothetical protein
MAYELSERHQAKSIQFNGGFSIIENNDWNIFILNKNLLH